MEKSGLIKEFVDKAREHLRQKQIEIRSRDSLEDIFADEPPAPTGKIVCEESSDVLN